MTVFAAAVDILHTDGNLSVAGTYTPAGGSAVPVRVIVSRDDQVLTAFDGGARAPGWRVSLKQSEVTARPTSDDLLTISEGSSAGNYVLRDVMEDIEQTTWTANLNRA